MTELAELKARMRATWMAGDFGEIARYSQPAADEFMARRGVQPGMRVLDVACGTGNLSIPAARAGADVTGVDIAPNLLAGARARAEAEQLTIRFDEGDAEELPYADESFDLVVTMFGAMFAPRPERVASELARVLHPGGTIAMANWTPGSFVGDMFKTTARHAPPPAGVVPPVLWGDEATVRARFRAVGIDHVEVTPLVAEFRYSFSERETVDFFRTYFGPTQAAFARLPEDGREALGRDLEQLWATHNRATDGTTAVDAEYLEVVARLR
jgi:ubiquinone/menaquinone biosynthesis C-methylase UbiE